MTVVLGQYALPEQCKLFLYELAGEQLVHPPMRDYDNVNPALISCRRENPQLLAAQGGGDANGIIDLMWPHA